MSAVILSLLISVVVCAQNDTTFLHRIATDIGYMLADVKMTSFKIDSVEESVKDMATNSRLDDLNGNMDELKEEVNDLNGDLKEEVRGFKGQMHDLIRKVDDINEKLQHLPTNLRDGMARILYG